MTLVADVSVGGSVDMVTSFLKIPKYGDRIYFGFSRCINVAYESPKTMDVIKCVPDDRLLLEVDVSVVV
jgi:Tat protein secretion system quality control protein TatD with DNase activity